MSILSSQEFARRIAAAQDAVRKNDLDAILVFATESESAAVCSAGLPDLSVQLNRDEQTENIRRIRNVYKKSAFDALIISAVCCPEDCRSLHEYLDLPEKRMIYNGKIHFAQNQKQINYA